MTTPLPAALRLSDAEIEYWAERYLGVPILGARGITFERFLLLPAERRERLGAGLEPWPALLPRQQAVQDTAWRAQPDAHGLPRRDGRGFEKWLHPRTQRERRVVRRPETVR
jgi:hypothetical protein